MDESILPLLQITKDPSEKAALVAEFVLSSLPERLALLARRCVVLHWFDLPLAKVLLQDISLTEDEIDALYRQLLTLPFIEELPWGAAFQDLTREGLLKHYAHVQPELLKTSARLAAPIYAARGIDDKLAAEALFCYMIAGDQEAYLTLFDTLLRHASHHEDWQYIDALFSLRDEARRLSFVSPFPISEEQLLLRDLVFAVQEIQAEIQHIDAHEANRTKETWTYISRGTRYAFEGHLKQAQASYNKALQLNPRLIPTYAARGVVAMAQDDYPQALRDFTTALESDADNLFLLQKQGTALNESDYPAEALAVYEHILRLDSNIPVAYREKGKALTKLERYEDALAAYEQSIFLDAYDAEAYAGKSVVLSRLRRYPEAQIAREIAERLRPEVPLKEEEAKQVSTPRKLPIGLINAEMVFRPRQQPTRNRQSIFPPFLERSLAVFVVALIIVAASILFPVIQLTSTGSGRPNATATANAYSTAPAISKAASKARATATAIAAATATAQANAQATASAAATATAQATAIASAIAGNPNPYPPGRGILALDDALSDNSKGNNWDSNSPNCAFTGGTYHVSAPNISSLATCIARSTNFSNFAYEVQMTIIKGDTGGILFRADATNNTYYVFYVSQTGRYELVLCPGTTCHDIIATAPSPAINQGLNKPNLLAVVALGNVLTLYVNHQQVAQVTDSTFNQGQIGLVASAFATAGHPTEVMYSNVRVWPL